MQYFEQRNPLANLPSMVSRAVAIGYQTGVQQQQQKQQQQSMLDRIMLQNELNQSNQLAAEKRRSYDQKTMAGYRPADVTSNVGPVQPPEGSFMGAYGNMWQPPPAPEAPEGYSVGSTAPGKYQFLAKPTVKETDNWVDYSDPKFPGVMLQKNTRTGAVKKVTDEPGTTSGSLASLRYYDSDGTLRQKYVSKNNFDVEVDKVIREGGELATGEAEGMSERRDMLSHKDTAKAEEIILANPEAEATLGHVNLFNRYSKTPYMYVQTKERGWFGAKTVTQRIDLPVYRGKQVTAADVIATAEEFDMTIQQVLEEISKEQGGEAPGA